MDYLLDNTADLLLIDVARSDTGAVDAQSLDIAQDTGAAEAPWNERYFDASGMKLIGRDGYDVREDTYGEGELDFTCTASIQTSNCSLGMFHLSSRAQHPRSIGSKT